jgi:hypothetical protein
MSTIQILNPPRPDGYPRITDISSRRPEFKTDRRDAAYERPIDDLYWDYQTHQTPYFIHKSKIRKND